MAEKTKQQLESELEDALKKIATLESDNLKLGADNEALTVKVDELQKALAASGKEKPPFPSGPDEHEVRRRMSAGLTRKQAEEAHAAQKAHDARLKKAAA
ncbi:hypothetical protein [Prosthecobacter vanneervenii]|uniref:Uncharacterized protein n=1 Tax=Prosthecobacter vanneervenii TaxID=48466 RepID=A0A7W7YBK2_9BACT|nr:hypothetical protein [Prosthecobacter vanneervenii]MBB5033164.1 hypothetical protein [Prosthecobacter vanneervenii]